MKRSALIVLREAMIAVNAKTAMQCSVQCNVGRCKTEFSGVNKSWLFQPSVANSAAMSATSLARMCLALAF